MPISQNGQSKLQGEETRNALSDQFTVGGVQVFKGHSDTIQSS